MAGVATLPETGTFIGPIGAFQQGDDPTKIYSYPVFTFDAGVFAITIDTTGAFTRGKISLAALPDLTFGDIVCDSITVGANNPGQTTIDNYGTLNQRGPSTFNDNVDVSYLKALRFVHGTDHFNIASVDNTVSPGATIFYGDTVQAGVDVNAKVQTRILIDGSPVITAKKAGGVLKFALYGATAQAPLTLTGARGNPEGPLKDLIAHLALRGDIATDSTTGGGTGLFEVACTLSGGTKTQASGKNLASAIIVGVRLTAVNASTALGIPLASISSNDVVVTSHQPGTPGSTESNDASTYTVVLAGWT